MKRRSSIGGLAAFTQIFLTLFILSRFSPAQAQKHDSVINIHAIVETAMAGLYSPEAVVVAESGDKFVFVANESKGFLPIPNPPTTPFLVKRDSTGAWGKPEKLLDKGLCTGIAFGNSDKWLIASVDYFTLAALKNLIYIISDPNKLGDYRGYKHRILIIDAQTRKEIMNLSSDDFGLKKTEILKHARVSPDGRWLSFYIHAYKEQRGIYLYNFETKKTFHLALEDDKHPTWAPDGTKILFHNQRGGNAHTNEELDVEEARLGYFDLKFDGNTVTWKRILIDPLNAPGIYHKHPTVYSGTDLVFFHKKHREEKNGKIALSSSSLYVRRLGVSTPIYKVTKLHTVDSLSVKTMKHIASAATLQKQSGIFLVGKEEDKSSKKNAEYKIYHLADKDVQKIAAEIARLESVR